MHKKNQHFLDFRNFKLYNIQNGSQIEIGKIIAGDMNLSSLPIYHDGTTKVNIYISFLQHFKNNLFMKF